VMYVDIPLRKSREVPMPDLDGALDREMIMRGKPN
jgi:hypothetical protein